MLSLRVLLVRRALAGATVLATLVSNAGCGSSDCEDACEATKECPGGEALQGADCGDACDYAEDYADDIGCRDQFDSLYACAAASDDVCRAGECQEEALAYGECFN